jgi:CHASE2 domain-containing sensor protein
MDLHTLGGTVGTGIIIGGYIPEIAQLVRKRRSEGVSITSYLLWSAASGLLLMHAWHIHSPVFIVLTTFQALACLLIGALAYQFRQGTNARKEA